MIILFYSNLQDQYYQPKKGLFSPLQGGNCTELYNQNLMLQEQYKSSSKNSNYLILGLKPHIVHPNDT